MPDSLFVTITHTQNLFVACEETCVQTSGYRYGRDDSIARADDLFKICQVLKGLSDEWHTPVICVNQVRDCISCAEHQTLMPSEAETCAVATGVRPCGQW